MRFNEALGRRGFLQTPKRWAAEALPPSRAVVSLPTQEVGCGASRCAPPWFPYRPQGVAPRSPLALPPCRGFLPTPRGKLEPMMTAVEPWFLDSKVGFVGFFARPCSPVVSLDSRGRLARCEPIELL